MPRVDNVRSECATVLVLTEPAELFAFLDDPRRSGMHMSDGSAMMMGGKMDYVFDGARGRAVGSKITMTGSFAGIGLSVEEIVTIHDPPWRKAWETVGTPSLLILTWYRMGLTIKPHSSGSELTVALDYRLPSSLFAGGLAKLAAPIYARWCVSRMANDARQNFDATVSNRRAHRHCPMR